MTGGHAHPAPLLALVGTYTDYNVLPHYPNGREGGADDGIRVFSFDADAGRLAHLHTVPCLNPAFMKVHPYLNVLYVLSECIHTEGYLTAYRIEPHTAQLHELARLPMTGRSTCYISFDRHAKHAVITNYWDGIINVVELSQNGVPTRIVQSHQQTRRETWRQVEDRADHMANRQDGPHAHCNVFHPSYRWVFVPDLGDNAIHQYGYEAGRLSHQTHIQLPGGEGPRHFVFHPTLPVAYSGCELLSRVQVFAVDASEPDEVRPRISAIQSFPTLPPGFTERNYVGEIKIDKAGRFVYVSNRGHDSIAVFAVDQESGLLSPVSIEPTLGRCPRHFGITPCGRYALVGDQDSNVVKTFRICASSGRLSHVEGAHYEMPSPNFVLFHRPYPAPCVDVEVCATPSIAMLEAAGPAAGGDGQHEELLVSPTAMVACS